MKINSCSDVVSITLKSQKEQSELKVGCLSKTRELIDENFVLQSNNDVNWFSFVREVLNDYLSENQGQLGRRVKGRSVFGGMDRTTIQTFLIPVVNRHKSILLPIGKKYQLNQLKN